MKKIYLFILLVFLFNLPIMELSAQYISSTTTQTGNTNVYPGQINAMVLRVEIEIDSLPVTLKNMLFNTIGSSFPPADINVAKLWHYNDSAATDPTLGVLIGIIPQPWATNLTFPGTYSGMIPSQKNYFWLTYDLATNATLCNYIDGAFVQFSIDNITYAPTISSPPGYQLISPCGTGLGDELLEEAFVVYPIPCKDELTLSVNAKIRESVTIELYGASGSKLVTLFDGLVDSALSEFNFSLKKFPPGVYYLNCISKRGVVVKWIVKV